LRTAGGVQTRRSAESAIAGCQATSELLLQGDSPAAGLICLEIAWPMSDIKASRWPFSELNRAIA
jgi:hypothetical protein